MAKKKRGSQNSPFLPLTIIAVAIIAGCSLLGPRHHGPSPHSPAPATPEPAYTAVATSAPSPEPTATRETSPTPEVSGSERGPKLALIIDDCGQWITTERGFLALPIPLTVSVLPDVPYTATIQHEASDAGKGIMLHLPMETVSGLNPGPGKVTTEMTDAQIQAQVAADLAQVSMAQGVNNHEGSKGSADPRVMHDVAKALTDHGGLFFIDSKTAANSVAQEVASQAGLQTASRDVFLDNKEDVAYTEGQLREAAAIAKRTGSAIAIGHPRPTTLEAVKNLIPELQADGISFVLVRTLVH